MNDDPRYIQLVGLLTLAHQANQHLKQIEDSAGHIFGLTPETYGGYGVLSDMIYESEMPSPANIRAIYEHLILENGL